MSLFKRHYKKLLIFGLRCCRTGVFLLNKVFIRTYSVLFANCSDLWQSKVLFSVDFEINICNINFEKLCDLVLLNAVLCHISFEFQICHIVSFLIFSCFVFETNFIIYLCIKNATPFAKFFIFDIMFSKLNPI